MTNTELEKLKERLTRLYAQLSSGGKNYDADAVAETLGAIESLQADIVRLTGENILLRGQRLGVLALMYQVAPTSVAKMCDEDLDRSGALLGEVREMSRAALQPIGEEEQ